MSSVADVCEGIAANLVALRESGAVGHVSAYLERSPKTPYACVAGIDATGIEYTTFGVPGSDTPPGMRYLIVVEAGTSSLDIAEQDKLRALMAPAGDASLVAAVESDTRLTRRLKKDGTIENADAAADAVAFAEFRGQTSFTFPSGVEVLLESWVFEVLT
jgi:hypothetical protein